MHIWKWIRAVIFFFDAEWIHGISLWFIKLGVFFKGRPLRIISHVSDKNHLTTFVLGKEFLSPLGLAAGFDKNAEILLGLPDLGFGFAEIGTVTPRPQEGNPKPRLFRDPKEQTLFNQMGFNNDGAQEIAKRVKRARKLLPKNFRIGVNLGKNRQTLLEDAYLDYVEALKPFNGLADYFVVNVSSPNTPGLRTLQNPESLIKIVESLRKEISTWSEQTPLLVKLSPEVSFETALLLIDTIEPLGISGWILTNTLEGRWKDGSNGGMSGRVLCDQSRMCLEWFKQHTSLALISVGGIMDEAEALKRMQIGASLIQIYSGWIYQGPSFPSKILKLLKQQKLDTTLPGSVR